jgi:hypothetical protein
MWKAQLQLGRAFDHDITFAAQLELGPPKKNHGCGPGLATANQGDDLPPQPFFGPSPFGASGLAGVSSLALPKKDGRLRPTLLASSLIGNTPL